MLEKFVCDKIAAGRLALILTSKLQLALYPLYYFLTFKCSQDFLIFLPTSVLKKVLRVHCPSLRTRSMRDTFEATNCDRNGRNERLSRNKFISPEIFYYIYFIICIECRHAQRRNCFPSFTSPFVALEHQVTPIVSRTWSRILHLTKHNFHLFIILQRTKRHLASLAFGARNAAEKYF